MPDALHKFNSVHIGEDLSRLSGMHENELLFECTLCKLNGLTLKDCDLNRSKFTTDRVQDALGFTLTLDCKAFQNVEYSPLLVDLLLTLITLTKLDDSKRQKIVEAIGAERWQALKRVLNKVE